MEPVADRFMISAFTALKEHAHIAQTVMESLINNALKDKINPFPNRFLHGFSAFF
jgi:hypothetical protein